MKMIDPPYQQFDSEIDSRVMTAINLRLALTEAARSSSPQMIALIQEALLAAEEEAIEAIGTDISSYVNQKRSEQFSRGFASHNEANFLSTSRFGAE